MAPRNLALSYLLASKVTKFLMAHLTLGLDHSGLLPLCIMRLNQVSNGAQMPPEKEFNKEGSGHMMGKICYNGRNFTNLVWQQTYEYVLFKEVE